MNLLFKITHSENFTRLIKFGIVGFTGLLWDFGITYSMKELLLFNKYLSNSCGFAFAASANFILNRYWTFKSNKSFYREYLLFISAAVVGLGLNNLIILLLDDHLNFYISKAIAVVLVFAWNFLINSKVTFKHS